MPPEVEDSGAAEGEADVEAGAGDKAGADGATGAGAVKPLSPSEEVAGRSKGGGRQSLTRSDAGRHNPNWKSIFRVLRLTR